MKIRSLAIGALALVLPLSAAACGGKDDNNSGKRPSVEEISAGMKKVIPGADSGSDEQLTCLAEKLHASDDMPNGVLRAIADGRDPEIDKDNEDKYTEVLTESMGECVSQALEDLDLPEDIEIPDGTETEDQ